MIVVGVTAVLLLAAAVVGAFGSRSVERPEGIAERWMSAVADTTRPGVGDDARHRAAEHGDVALISGLVPAGNYDGSTAFTAYEVGHADREAGGVARVPVRLVHRVGSDAVAHVVLVLQPAGTSWRVAAVDPSSGALRVPSEGGPPVSRAPISLYLGGLLFAIAMGAACTLLLRVADRFPVATQTA
jgi:hypothetical protein